MRQIIAVGSALAVCALIALQAGLEDPIESRPMPSVARGAASEKEVHSRCPNPSSPPSALQNGRPRRPGDTVFSSAVDPRPLVRELAQQPSAERREAALALAHRDPAALLALARDPGAGTRERLIAWDLWSQTAAARLDVLSAALLGAARDASPIVRAHLARLVRQLDPVAAPDLLSHAVVAEADPDARRRLIRELSLAGAVADPAPLVRAMAGERDAALRTALADYLARHVHGAEARQAVRRALYASWEQLGELDRMRLLAAAGLAERTQLAADLALRVRDAEQDARQRVEAIRVLARLDDPQVRGALAEAAARDSSLPVRLAAIDGLARRAAGGELLGELLAGDASPEVRARAAARIPAGDPRQAALLVRAAQADDAPAVRAAALLRLAGADRRSTEVVATVRGALVGGETDEVKLAAARSLAVLLRRRREQIDGSELAAVVALARDGGALHTRLAAVEILSIYGDRRSVEQIERLSRQAPDARVRARAGQMLRLGRRGS